MLAVLQELRTLQQADAAKVVAVRSADGDDRRSGGSGGCDCGILVRVRRAGDADRIASDDSNGATVGEMDLRHLQSLEAKSRKLKPTSHGAAWRVNATMLLPVAHRQESTTFEFSTRTCVRGYREGLGRDSQLRHNSRSRD